MDTTVYKLISIKEDSQLINVSLCDHLVVYLMKLHSKGESQSVLIANTHDMYQDLYIFEPSLDYEILKCIPHPKSSIMVLLLDNINTLNSTKLSLSIIDTYEDICQLNKIISFDISSIEKRSRKEMKLKWISLDYLMIISSSRIRIWDNNRKILSVLYEIPFDLHSIVDFKIGNKLNYGLIATSQSQNLYTLIRIDHNNENSIEIKNILAGVITEDCIYYLHRKDMLYLSLIKKDLQTLQSVELGKFINFYEGKFHLLASQNKLNFYILSYQRIDQINIKTNTKTRYSVSNDIFDWSMSHKDELIRLIDNNNNLLILGKKGYTKSENYISLHESTDIIELSVGKHDKIKQIAYQEEHIQLLKKYVVDYNYYLFGRILKLHLLVDNEQTIELNRANILNMRYIWMNNPIQNENINVYIPKKNDIELTETTQNHYRKLLNCIESNQPVLIEGDTGTGKTSIIEYAATQLKKPLIRMNLHAQTSIEDFLGCIRIKNGHNSEFVLGKFAEAVKEGYWLLLDEANIAPDSILRIVESVLSTKILTITGTHINSDPRSLKGTMFIKYHPNFRLFMTQNPSKSMKYANSRNQLSLSLLSHFVPIAFKPMKYADLFSIAETKLKSLNDLNYKEISKKLVDIYLEVANINENTSSFTSFTIRDLKNACDILIKSKKKPDMIDPTICLQLLFAQNLSEEASINIKNKIKNLNIQNNQYIFPKFNKIDHLVYLSEYDQLMPFLDLCFQTKRPGLIIGESHTGKITAIDYWIQNRKNSLNINEPLIINCTADMTVNSFEGNFMPKQDTENKLEFHWIDGPLVQAIKNRKILILRGINELDSKVLEAFNPYFEVAEEKKIIINQEIITIPEDFFIFATASVNTSGLKKLFSPALLNRFLIYKKLDYISKEDMIKLLTFYNNSNLLTEICTESEKYNLNQVSFLQKGIRKILDQNMKKDSSSIQDYLKVLIKISQSNRISQELKTIPIFFDNLFCVCDEKSPKEFYLSESRKYIANLLIFCINFKIPIILQGAAGIGKTEIIKYIANLLPEYKSKNFNDSSKLKIIRFNKETSVNNIMGQFLPQGTSCIYEPGPLFTAMKNGYLVLLDELNLAPPETLSFLSSIFLYKKSILNPINYETLNIHENFRIIGTQNPPNYSGRQVLPKSIKSRSVILEVPIYDENEITNIITKKYEKYDKKDIEKILKLIGYDCYKPDQPINIRHILKIVKRVNACLNENTISKKGILIDFNTQVLFPDFLKMEPIFKDIQAKISINEQKNEIYFHLFSKSNSGLPIDLPVCFPVNKIPIEEIKLFEGLHSNAKILICKLAFCKFYGEPVLIKGPSSFKTFCCRLFSKILTCPTKVIYLSALTDTTELFGGFEPHNIESFEKYLRGYLSNDAEIKNIGNIDNLIHYLQKKNTQFGEKYSKVMEKMKDQIKSKSIGMHFPFCEREIAQFIRLGGIIVLKDINLPDQAITESLNSLLEDNPSFTLQDSDVKINKDFMLIATMNNGLNLNLSNALESRFTSINITIPERLINDIIEKEFSKSEIDFIKIFLKCYKETFGYELFSKMPVRYLYYWNKFRKVEIAQNTNGYSNYGELYKLMIGAQILFLDSFSIDKQKAFTKMMGKYLEPISLINYPKESNLEVKKFDNTCVYLEYLGIKIPITEEKFKEKISKYSLSLTLVRNLSRLLCCEYTKLPICLSGPPGVGKTAICQLFASMLDRSFYRICCSDSLTLEDLFGSYAPKLNDNGDMSFEFMEGLIFRAIKEDKHAVILFDEINLCSSEVLSSLAKLFDLSNSNLQAKDYIIDKSEAIFLCAMNPPKVGGGRQNLPQSLSNLFINVSVEDFTQDEISNITKKIYSKTLNSILNNNVDSILDIHFNLPNHLKTYQYYLDSNFNIRHIQKVASILNNIPINSVQTDQWFKEYIVILANLMVYSFSLKDYRARNIAKKFILKKYNKSDNEKEKYFEIEPYDQNLRIKCFTGEQCSQCSVQRSANLSLFPTPSPLVKTTLMQERLMTLWIAFYSRKPIIIEGPSCSGKTTSIIELARLLNLPYKLIPMHPDFEVKDFLGSFGISNQILRVRKKLLDLVQNLKRKFPKKKFELLRTTNSYESLLQLLLMQFNSKERNELLNEINYRSEIQQEQIKFEFYDGVLKEAYDNGGLIIFDGIECASSEILERLNSLGEENGVLHLFEFGADNKVKEPHKDFRLIFICNPYRVGAKRLSETLYNRCIIINYPSFEEIISNESRYESIEERNEWKKEKSKYEKHFLSILSKEFNEGNNELLRNNTNESSKQIFELFVKLLQNSKENKMKFNACDYKLSIRNLKKLKYILEKTTTNTDDALELAFGCDKEEIESTKLQNIFKKNIQSDIISERTNKIEYLNNNDDKELIKSMNNQDFLHEYLRSKFDFPILKLIGTEIIIESKKFEHPPIIEFKLKNGFKIQYNNILIHLNVESFTFKAENSEEFEGIIKGIALINQIKFGFELSFDNSQHVELNMTALESIITFENLNEILPIENISKQVPEALSKCFGELTFENMNYNLIIKIDSNLSFTSSFRVHKQKKPFEILQSSVYVDKIDFEWNQEKKEGNLKGMLNFKFIRFLDFESKLPLMRSLKENHPYFKLEIQNIPLKSIIQTFSTSESSIDIQDTLIFNRGIIEFTVNEQNIDLTIEANTDAEWNILEFALFKTFQLKIKFSDGGFLGEISTDLYIYGDSQYIKLFPLSIQLSNQSKNNTGLEIRMKERSKVTNKGQEEYDSRVLSTILTNNKNNFEIFNNLRFPIIFNDFQLIYYHKRKAYVKLDLILNWKLDILILDSLDIIIKKLEAELNYKEIFSCYLKGEIEFLRQTVKFSSKFGGKKESTWDIIFDHENMLNATLDKILPLNISKDFKALENFGNVNSEKMITNTLRIYPDKTVEFEFIIEFINQNKPWKLFNTNSLQIKSFNVEGIKKRKNKALIFTISTQVIFAQILEFPILYMTIPSSHNKLKIKAKDYDLKKNPIDLMALLSSVIHKDLSNMNFLPKIDQIQKFSFNFKTMKLKIRLILGKNWQPISFLNFNKILVFYSGKLEKYDFMLEAQLSFNGIPLNFVTDLKHLNNKSFRLASSMRDVKFSTILKGLGDSLGNHLSVDVFENLKFGLVTMSYEYNITSELHHFRLEVNDGEWSPFGSSFPLKLIKINSILDYNSGKCSESKWADNIIIGTLIFNDFEFPSVILPLHHQKNYWKLFIPPEEIELIQIPTMKKFNEVINLRNFLKRMTGIDLPFINAEMKVSKFSVEFTKNRVDKFENEFKIENFTLINEKIGLGQFLIQAKNASFYLKYDSNKQGLEKIKGSLLRFDLIIGNIMFPSILINYLYDNGKKLLIKIPMKEINLTLDNFLETFTQFIGITKQGLSKIGLNTLQFTKLDLELLLVYDNNKIIIEQFRMYIESITEVNILDIFKIPKLYFELNYGRSMVSQNNKPPENANPLIIKDKSQTSQNIEKKTNNAVCTQKNDFSVELGGQISIKNYIVNVYYDFKEQSFKIHDSNFSDIKKIKDIINKKKEILKKTSEDIKKIFPDEKKISDIHVIDILKSGPAIKNLNLTLKELGSDIPFLADIVNQTSIILDNLTYMLGIIDEYKEMAQGMIGLMDHQNSVPEILEQIDMKKTNVLESLEIIFHAVEVLMPTKKSEIQKFQRLISLIISIISIHNNFSSNSASLYYNIFNNIMKYILNECQNDKITQFYKIISKLVQFFIEADYDIMNILKEPNQSTLILRLTSIIMINLYDGNEELITVVNIIFQNLQNKQDIASEDILNIAIELITMFYPGIAEYIWTFKKIFEEIVNFIEENLDPKINIDQLMNKLQEDSHISSIGIDANLQTYIPEIKDIFIKYTNKKLGKETIIAVLKVTIKIVNNKKFEEAFDQLIKFYESIDEMVDLFKATSFNLNEFIIKLKEIIKNKIFDSESKLQILLGDFFHFWDKFTQIKDMIKDHDFHEYAFKIIGIVADNISNSINIDEKLKKIILSIVLRILKENWSNFTFKGCIDLINEILNDLKYLIENNSFNECNKWIKLIFDEILSKKPSKDSTLDMERILVILKFDPKLDKYIEWVKKNQEKLSQDKSKTTEIRKLLVEELFQSLNDDDDNAIQNVGNYIKNLPTKLNNSTINELYNSTIENIFPGKEKDKKEESAERAFETIKMLRSSIESLLKESIKETIESTTLYSITQCIGMIYDKPLSKLKDLLEKMNVKIKALSISIVETKFYIMAAYKNQEKEGEVLIYAFRNQENNKNEWKFMIAIFVNKFKINDFFNNLNFFNYWELTFQNKVLLISSEMGN